MGKKKTISSEPAGTGSIPTGAVPNKTDAIREAVKAGYIKPKDGVGWIRKTYGLEVSPQTFSTTKFQDAKKVNVHVKAKKPASAKPSPITASASAVELAKQVKLLVRLYGADAVQEMVALFSD